MKIPSIIISLLFAGLFLIACSGNEKADKKSKNTNTPEVQSLVYEGYQNEAGDILYMADFPEENTVHIKAKGEEFILNKEDGSTSDLSNEEITLIQKNGKTILKRNNEIIFEQNPKIISGKLNLGHKENAIIDCATGYSFWVNDKTGKLQGIYDNLIGDNNKAYNPIFVKVKTVDRGKTSEGPSASFNSVYDIIEIISSRKATDNDCIE